MCRQCLSMVFKYPDCHAMDYWCWTPNNNWYISNKHILLISARQTDLLQNTHNLIMGHIFNSSDLIFLVYVLFFIFYHLTIYYYYSIDLTSLCQECRSSQTSGWQCQGDCQEVLHWNWTRKWIVCRRVVDVESWDKVMKTKYSRI